MGEALRERWEAGERNAHRLWLELKAQGYRGCYSTVVRTVAPRRAALPADARRYGSRPASRWRLPSPRSVVYWLLRRAEDRKPAQTEFLGRLAVASPKLQQAQALTAEFLGLVRERRETDFDRWAAAVQASGISELQGFVSSLQRDEAAVRAGLSQSWSNGPVEGQVNRLKLIKRQMYGRASFALLRARVLPPAGLG